MLALNPPLEIVLVYAPLPNEELTQGLSLPHIYIYLILSLEMASGYTAPIHPHTHPHTLPPSAGVFLLLLLVGWFWR